MGEMVSIASPSLDQAKTIARFIRNGRDRDCHIVGKVLPDEAMPRVNKPFDMVEPVEWENLAGVIPTGSRSTSALLEQSDLHLGDVVMRREMLRFYDKPWSLNLAAAAAVPVPTTWLDPLEDIRFPVFYKSREEGGGMRGLARTRDELPIARGLIFQEYIPTPGTYGVGFVARQGELLLHHSHFEVESYPELGGSAVFIEQIRDERLLRHARSIIALSDFDGWGLIEFKYCPSRDDFVFMELNAKFWASIEFTFRNEPDFARILFGVEPFLRPCTRMIFMHRALRRGGSFVARSLPGYLKGSELNWGDGAWLAALPRALLPTAAVQMFRGIRRA